LEIPNLILLPGQIWRLRGVLEQEIKRRRKLTSSPPPLPPPRSTTPERDQNYDDVENVRLSCFYKVSRMEAESLLAKNIEFGNLLMRPSTDDRDLSVSTRQAFNNGTIVKHYRIRCVDSGYIIDIDEGVLCNSRQEIVEYFIQQTNGVLKPLEIPTDYEINLSIVEEDAESGELIHRKLDTLTGSATKTLPVKKGKQSPKKPVIIESETGRINNNEIEKLNQANMQRIVKVELRAHLKIDPPAMPRQPINFPGLTYDVTKELNKKLQQRRAAMSE
ncbi:signal-transducing adaptor protein 1-like, partial [Rhinoraja longicauda]